MEIKFLGTGGAFDYEYGNSAAWITLQGQRFLLDCGNTVYSALRRAGLSNSIDHLLITHLHDDHAGSLASIILHHSYFLQPARKASLIVPSKAFQEELYEFLCHALVHPEQYVEFVPVDQIPGLTAVDTYGLHVPGMQSYGFIFEDEQEVLAYSGDLGDPNIIFQRVTSHLTQKSVRVFHELSFDQTDGIHTYYRDLFPWLSKFDIYGYHIDPSQNPADNLIPLAAHHHELLVAHQPWSV